MEATGEARLMPVGRGLGQMAPGTKQAPVKTLFQSRKKKEANNVLLLKELHFNL